MRFWFYLLSSLVGRLLIISWQLWTSLTVAIDWNCWCGWRRHGWSNWCLQFGFFMTSQLQPRIYLSFSQWMWALTATALSWIVYGAIQATRWQSWESPKIDFRQGGSSPFFFLISLLFLPFPSLLTQAFFFQVYEPAHSLSFAQGIYRGRPYLLSFD